MTFDEFTDRLKEAGWRATCDAQYTGIEKLYQEIVRVDRQAREECAEICDYIGNEFNSYAAVSCSYQIRESIKKWIS